MDLPRTNYLPNSLQRIQRLLRARSLRRRNLARYAVPLRVRHNSDLEYQCRLGLRLILMNKSSPNHQQQRRPQGYRRIRPIAPPARMRRGVKERQEAKFETANCVARVARVAGGCDRLKD